MKHNNHCGKLIKFEEKSREREGVNYTCPITEEEIKKMNKELATYAREYRSVLKSEKAAQRNVAAATNDEESSWDENGDSSSWV